MSDYEMTQLLNSLDSAGGGSYSNAVNAAQGAGIWGTIAVILAIIGGILIYFLFVKAVLPAYQYMPKTTASAGFQEIPATRLSHSRGMRTGPGRTDSPAFRSEETDTVRSRQYR